MGEGIEMGVGWVLGGGEGMGETRIVGSIFERYCDG